MPERTPAHETKDVDIRAIVVFGAILLAIVGAVSLGTSFVLDFLGSRPDPSVVLRSPLARNELPPQPRLQVAPPADMRVFLAREDAVLSSYAWVDRPQKIVRIPIDRAKTLLLERGFPIRPSGERP